MSIAEAEAPPIQTLADLLSQLGDIAPERVRFHPAPGTAQEGDVLLVERSENRLCELVDGVLVEKLMGYRESLLSVALANFLESFVSSRNLGLVSGPDGMVRLFPGLVRIPDVAFVSWDQIPDGAVPTAPIPDLVPDLVVEIISAGNTVGEMRRKRREYFDAGVKLVWFVESEPQRLVTIYTAPDECHRLSEADCLTAGDVLPGFKLQVGDLFGKLDRKRP